MAMTVDRVVAVRMPLKYTSICTATRARWTTIIIFFTMLTYSIPQAFFAKIVGKNTCASLGVKSKASTIYAFCSLVINCFIPFTLLMVMNCMIIYTTRSRGKLFARDDSTSNSVTTGSSGTSGTGKNKALKKTVSSGSTTSSKGRENQLTAMLILVTFALLILTIPQYLRYLVFSLIKYKHDPQLYATYILLYHSSQKIAFINNAINFFLYCFSGSRFVLQTIVTSI